MTEEESLCVCVGGGGFYCSWATTTQYHINTGVETSVVGLLGEAPLAAGKLPAEEAEEEEEPALDDMQRRLEALKS